MMKKNPSIFLIIFAAVASVPSVHAQSQFNFIDLFSRFVARTPVSRPVTVRTSAGPVTIVADNTFDGTTGGIDASIILPNGNTASVAASVNINPGTSASVSGSATTSSGQTAMFSNTATPSSSGMTISSSFTSPNGNTQTNTVTLTTPENSEDIFDIGLFQSILKRVRRGAGPGGG